MADTYVSFAMPERFRRRGIHTYHHLRMMDFHAALALCQTINREELYKAVQATGAADRAAMQQLCTTLEVAGLADFA